MLLRKTVECIACGESIDTFVQYTHSCTRCGKEIEVCTDCRMIRHISYERCPLCGGKIGKSNYEKATENGMQILY